MNISDINLL